jgi:hypothetical protein
LDDVQQPADGSPSLLLRRQCDHVAPGELAPASGADQQPQRGTVGRSRALLWNDGSTLLVDRARSRFVAEWATPDRLLLRASGRSKEKRIAADLTSPS